MKTKELPNTIFLQIHGDNESVGNHDEISFDDVTWSEDRIYPTDVEYTKVKSPWISIDERFPDDKEQVLVSSQIYGKVVLVWDKLGMVWVYPDDNDVIYCNWDKVDCWMPIPE